MESETKLLTSSCSNKFSKRFRFQPCGADFLPELSTNEMKAIMPRRKPCWGWGPLTSNALSVSSDFTVDYSNFCYLCAALMEKYPVFCHPLFLSTTAAGSLSESFAPAWAQLIFPVLQPVFRSTRFISLFSAQQPTQHPRAWDPFTLTQTPRSLLQDSWLLPLHVLLHHRNAPCNFCTLGRVPRWSNAFLFPQVSPQWLQVGQNCLLVVVLEITGLFWAFFMPGGVVGGEGCCEYCPGGQGPGMPNILYCVGFFVFFFLNNDELS